MSQNNNNQQSQESTNPSSSTSRRGLNWTIEEDKQLCNSWLEVSIGPVVGADQSSHTYWGRMKAHFDSHIGTRVSNRSPISLKARWTVIKTAVSAFCGSVSHVERQNPSGADSTALVSVSYSLA